MIDSQLLCTFTTKSNLENTVNTIKQSYTIVFDKIYVLQNEDRNKELICTYNVEVYDGLDYNAVPNTISLHRKKHTNTFQQDHDLIPLKYLYQCLRVF